MRVKASSFSILEVPVDDAESRLELLRLELLKHPGLGTTEHVFHEATAVRCHNVLGCEQVARHAGIYVGVGVAIVLLLGVRNEVAGELQMLGYGVLRYSPNAEYKADTISAVSLYFHNSSFLYSIQIQLRTATLYRDFSLINWQKQQITTSTQILFNPFFLPHL